MIHRALTSAGVLILLVALGVATAARSTLAQSTPGSERYSVPRTAYGHPDLQGFWTNQTLSLIHI